MSAFPPESDILPALLGADAAGAQPRSPLEDEVVGLFDQFRDRLLRYLLSFGLPVSDCEELIQETFLALFQHLNRGRPRRNLPSWLFRVAHNLALKKRLRLRRDTLMTSAPDSVIDPSPSPEDQSVSNQTHKRLLAVLRALPEQNRRCLALRAEGLRYREIAEVLDMSLGAVSLSLGQSLARLARARER
jgi:RNA polymerase sigma-70 factor, ECF subfamily